MSKISKLRRNLLPNNISSLVQRTAIEDRSSSSLRVSMSWRTYRWVVLAILLLAGYLYGIADDRFASETALKVQSTEQAPQLTLAVPGSLLGGGGPGTEDSRLLLAYVHSYDMLRAVEQELDFRGHYSDDQWDPFYRMASDLPFEDVFEYYTGVVTPEIDLETNIMTVEVQAFTPVFAQNLAQVILEEADRFINAINKDIARREIAFFNDELDLAERELREAEEKLLAFQDQVQELSPLASSEAFQELINTLEARISEKESELRTLQAFQNDDSFEVRTMKDQLQALKDQLKAERAKISGDSEQSSNELTTVEARLRRNLEFATERYQRTLSVIEQKRIASSQNIKHLVIVQSPKISEKAKYPDRLYIILTVLILLSVGYAITVMVVATVQEHSDV